MNNLEFIIFYFSIFLSGRGVVVFLLFLFNKKNKNPENICLLETNISVFYSIICLLLFGNLIFLFHFVASVVQIRAIIFTIFLISILLNFLKKLNNLFSFYSLFNNFLIPLILGFSIYGNRLHADAGYYHLPHQYWLRNEKIIFGLGNLDIYLSTSSMYEYLSSILWINNNFNFLHYLNLTFFVSLFSFLTFHLVKKDKDYLFFTSFSLLIFSLLDNFGFYGGSNAFVKVQTIGKPDVAVGVLIYIISVTLIQLILNKDFSFKNLTFSLYLITFTFQIRIFGVMLFLIWSYYLFNYLNSKNIQMSKFLYGIFPSIFVLITWSIKNFINSGCFIFPIVQTCGKSLLWFNLVKFEQWSNSWKDWPYSYRFNKNFLNWIVEWFNSGTNYQEVPNYFFSMMLIYLINKYFFKQINENKKEYTLIKLYFFCSLLFFLVYGFHIRYMYGLILLSITLLSLKNKDIKQKFIILNNKKLFYILIFISVSIVPRGYSYKYFIENSTDYYKIEVLETFELFPNTGWGSNSSIKKCYTIPNCTGTKNELKLKNFYFNYLIFDK